MKSGILINSYRLPLESSLLEAKRTGVDGIQLYAIGKNYDLMKFSSTELDRLRNSAGQLKLGISALCAELGGHGFQLAAENPEKIARTKRIIDIARFLGAPVITTHIGVVPENSSDPVYRVMIEAMSELGAYAADRQVAIGIETGPESPEALREFLRRTDGAVGVNLDPANLLMVRNCDPVEAIHTLADSIVYAHFKDGLHYRDCDPVRVYTAFAEGGFPQLQAETGKLFEETAPGKGGVDFRGCLEAFRQTGYDYYFTVEREGGDSPVAEVNAAASYLKQLLEEFAS